MLVITRWYHRGMNIYRLFWCSISGIPGVLTHHFSCRKPFGTPGGAPKRIKATVAGPQDVTHVCIYHIICNTCICNPALRAAAAEIVKRKHALAPPNVIYVYIYVYINVYNIHTYLHKYLPSYLRPTYAGTDILTYLHIYIFTYIQTYRHTDIHTDIQMICRYI